MCLETPSGSKLEGVYKPHPALGGKKKKKIIIILTATANFKTISQAGAINLSHRVVISSHLPTVLNIIRKSV